MTWKGIQHKSVGEELDSAEFHSETLHEIPNGTELPSSGEAGDLYRKTDDGRIYTYIQE